LIDAAAAAAVGIDSGHHISHLPSCFIDCTKTYTTPPPPPSAPAPGGTRRIFRPPSVSGACQQNGNYRRNGDTACCPRSDLLGGDRLSELVEGIVGAHLDVGRVDSAQNGASLVVANEPTVDHQQHLGVGGRAEAVDFVVVALGEDAEKGLAGVLFLLDH